MKIGIMTYFMPINYGAYLQAYALSHRLNQEDDIEAEIINFHLPAEDKNYDRDLKLHKNIMRVVFNRRRFKVFRNSLKYLDLSSQNCCTSDNDKFIAFVRGKYDIIIAGSDEIWRVDGYKGFSVPYFLPGDLNCKKVSYAVSGRDSFSKLPLKDQELLKKYLDDFDYIGVRDLITFDRVQDVITEKDKLHINFDPSFVYDFQPNALNGKKLIKKYFHLSGKKKIIAFMYTERVSAKPNLERYLQKKYGKEVDFISLYEWCPYFKNSSQINPLEWVDIIAAVDGVISMYFHGICYALITGTPFFAIENRSSSDQESKLFDLLSRLDLLDSYTHGIDNIIGTDKMDLFINNVHNGIRFDSSSLVTEARDEFEDFINEIRRIYSKPIVQSR